MENPWLDRLLKDIRTVYEAIPATGALEHWLIGFIGNTDLGRDADEGAFMALDLDLMTEFGILRIGSAPDASGDLSRAYMPTGVSVDILLDAIHREYEAIPEGGHIPDREYFSSDLDDRQRAVRDALRDANAISYLYTGGDTDPVLWVRGQSGHTNYADAPPSA